jgi:hypothetical protein
MIVKVHLYSQSQPIKCENVLNTYTKGPMFCIMYKNNTVDKFPVEKIFRVRESE